MVSDLLFSNSNGSKRGDRSDSHFYYTDVFNDKFPYYLSIGMSENQYWDSDCTLVKFYRKADEIRQERINREMWLQGLYVYEAIGRISPILHDFAKKGTKPKPYLDKPFPITNSKVNDAKLEKEKRVSDKGKMYMEQFMVKNNQRFKRKDV